MQNERADSLRHLRDPFQGQSPVLAQKMYASSGRGRSRENRRAISTGILSATVPRSIICICMVTHHYGIGALLLGDD